MISAMDESRPVRSNRGKPDSSPHHEPYPDRLHRHLAAAADAAASLAPESGGSDLPTPADLVHRWGGFEAVNTTESEVSDDE